MPLCKNLRQQNTAVFMALLLGCQLALPAICAADDDEFFWEINTSSTSTDVYGPFKLIYLQKGDSIDVIHGQNREVWQPIENDIPADSTMQSLVLPTVFSYYGELLGQNAYAGSISIFIGFTPQEDYLAAASTTFGDLNGPVYKALVNDNPNPSYNCILYNSNAPLSLYDYPRAINITAMGDVFQTSLHEFTHSLGVMNAVEKTKDETENNCYYWNENNFNAYSGHLYDIFGTQAKPGQLIKIIKNQNEISKSDNVFYLCSPDTLAENIKHVTFHGENVDTLTNNEGIPVLGALNRSGNISLENGSSLSHNNLAVSYLNYGNLNSTTMVTELDLAMLQDIGYKIDRSKYFGKSYLKYGEEGKRTTAVNDKDFISSSMLAVGTHIYRNNLKLTQKGNINIAPQDSQDFFSAIAGCGIMISGAHNTVDIPEGTTISVSGATGTGIGVNYGANNTINIAGNVQANGYDGIGLLVASGYVNYYSEDAYGYTHKIGDLEYDASVDNSWKEIYEDNAELKKITEQAMEDNHGFSIKQLNITGILEGERAAIYTNSTNVIEEINVMGEGKIIGDITSNGCPTINYVGYLKATSGKAPETRLTFGHQSNDDGTPNGDALDQNFQGNFTGNIADDWGEPLNYNLELLSGSLDLNKDNPQNIISILSVATNPGTSLNVQGLLSAETKAFGYPRGENIGKLNIYGTLAPGGDGFGYVNLKGDSFNQGASGKLQLDFDFNSGQRDVIGLSGWKSANYDLDAPFKVNLQNIEFVQKNSYEGSPVMLTREDFFPIVSGDVIINDENLEASLKDSATQFTKLRDGWAVYDFSQGFAPHISGVVQTIGKILDSRLSIEQLNEMQEDDWSLYRALMLPGNNGKLNDSARQLSGLAYAEQLEASMNVNRLLSSTVRNSILERHTHTDDSWHWFAAPLAFTARKQNFNGYSQHGSGVLLGADKQFGANDMGIFGGYLHDNASFNTSDQLRSKRDGGFVGAYFKQAKARDNGPFAYGFARYDSSSAKNTRTLNINNSYLAKQHADFRQHGFAAELGAGWNKTTNAGTLTYNAGLNYGLVTQPAFTEHGSSASIKQSSEKYQTLSGNIGMQYTTNMTKLNAQTDYQLSVGARWQQTLWSGDRDYNVALLNGNIPVHWQSTEDNGWLELYLQGQLLRKNNLQLTAAVGTELFRREQRSLSGSVKLEYVF